MTFSELHYPEPYTVRDGLFGYMSVSPKGKEVFIPLCNFCPFVQSQVLCDNGLEGHVRVEIGAFRTDGTPLPTVTVNDEKFTSLDWIRSAWGYENNIETGKSVKDRLRHAIQSTAQFASKTFCYEATGWRKIDGKWEFLMPGDEQHTVKLFGRAVNYGFCRTGDISAVAFAYELLYRVAPERVMFPLLAFTFLSPLNSFLRQADKEPQTVLMLTGKTGLKKSTLAALMLSFFGKFSTSQLPLSFRDTANSVLKQSFLLKDVLTCVDDYHPSGGRDASDLNDKMQKLLRAYGNRCGRGRMNARAELMPDYYPQGNAIMTAEFSPDVSESGTARYLCMELNPTDVINEELTRFQEYAANGVLSYAMFRYTEWLKKEFLSDEDEFQKYLLELYRKASVQLRTLAEEEKGTTLRDRLLNDIVVLSIGFKFFTDFLWSERVVTPENRTNLQLDFRDILLDLAAKQQQKTVADQPTHIFLRKLFSLIESGRVTLLPKQDATGSIYDRTVIGYVDDEYYYLFSDQAHREVKRLCAEQGEAFSISENGLLKALADEMLSIHDSDGRTKKTVRIGSKTQRLLCLNKLDVQAIAGEV